MDELSRAGLLSEYGPRRFDEQRTISRFEMALLIARVLKALQLGPELQMPGAAAPDAGTPGLVGTASTAAVAGRAEPAEGPRSDLSAPADDSAFALAAQSEGLDVEQLLSRYQGPALEMLGSRMIEMVRELTTEFAAELDALGFHLTQAGPPAGAGPVLGEAGDARGPALLGAAGAGALDLWGPAGRSPSPALTAGRPGVGGSEPALASGDARANGGDGPAITVTAEERYAFGGRPLSELIAQPADQGTAGAEGALVSGISAGPQLEQRYRMQFSGWLGKDWHLEADWEGPSTEEGAGWGEGPGSEPHLSVGTSYRGGGNEVTARIGGLPERRLGVLSPTRLSGLSGVEAEFRLGEIGSTVLVARRLRPQGSGIGSGLGFAPEGGSRAASGGEYLALLDGSLQISERAAVGARLVRSAADDDMLGLMDEFSGRVTTVASLDASYSLFPGLTFSGEYSQNLWESLGSSALRLGALLQLWGVEVGARYQAVGASFRMPFEEPAAEAGDRTGLDLAVRMGPVELSTGRNQVRQESEGRLATTTSLGLRLALDRLGLASVGQVEAGYEFVDLASLAEQHGRPSQVGVRTRTRLGVDWGGESARVRLGLSWQGAGALAGGEQGEEGAADPAPAEPTRAASAGVELRLLENATALADVSFEGGDGSLVRTTSVGLRYRLEAAAELLVGYRLIDFASPTEAGRSENLATAELSIRF